MLYREATAQDAVAVATLHAESWRTHYRGAYRDEYLDGPVLEERIAIWRERLSVPPGNQFVVVADEAGELVGFACAYGADDATWGTLLDNLHVRDDHSGHGVGTRLLREIARWCRQNYDSCGLYLWVLDQNDRAQRFYRRWGAEDRGGEVSVPPGGGRIHGRRYVWRTAAEVSCIDLSAVSVD